MTYVLTDGHNTALSFPYGLEALRRDIPNTSFPSSMSDEALAEWYVFPCTIFPEPSVSDRQTAVMGVPKKVNGAWVVGWEVSTISDEEWAIKSAYQWSDIRAERNAKLAASDWTQLPDSPADKAAWASYRQALRDITKQPDPFNLTWPTPPF